MSAPKCTIVDYGSGNVYSVAQALAKTGADVELTGEIDAIRSADRLILPGVGAFGRVMERLAHLGLDDAVREFVRLERPFLGICVGMQVLLERGFEHGEHDGLGIIPGSVRAIPESAVDRIPLIGWHDIRETYAGAWTGTPLDGAGPTPSFYFVHSFAAYPSAPEHCLALLATARGAIPAMIGRGNTFGVQFHPERSSDGGLNFLASFLRS